MREYADLVACVMKNPKAAEQYASLVAKYVIALERLDKFVPLHDADGLHIYIGDTLKWGVSETLIEVVYEKGCHKAIRCDGQPLTGIKPDQLTFFPIWKHCRRAEI
jgi:hypothetical protein